MRKRLFIFAAATCFALSAFATPAFAEEPSLPDEPTSSSEALVQSDENSDENSNENSDGNSNENSDGNVKEDAPPSGNDDALSYSDEGQANAGVTTPVVAKIGNTGYTTLQEAINKAKSGDVITLQDDLTLNDEGLRFDGPKVSTPAEWKDITLDAAKHSLTLNDKGIFYHYGEPWNFDNWDGTGLAIAGTAVLHSGAEVTTNDNWGIGVWVYRDADNADSYPGGTLTVESGATLSSIHNANYGLANAYNLNIRSGAHVYLRENYDGGLDNYPLATTTVDTGADFVVSNNCGRGIKNGNSGNNHIGEPATLILNSGVIKENYNTKQMPSFPFLDAKGYGHNVDNGGGIYNEYGSVTLSSVAKVYNNHAENSGDDLYNSDVEGNSFNIVKLEPGAKWSVLDDDGCIIDDWYHDYAGEENRWKPATAKNNTVTELPRGAALKAAHGINAPTPSPKPVEPTATPTPTAAPTAAPTTAPTAAPTAAPTTAPADNTATAAPATPAPTAQPIVTATPAPTAQASGVIPQTGDSSSPALFSILTLGSITALCVLQKRRKSK